jgi:hypothetical protein
VKVGQRVAISVTHEGQKITASEVLLGVVESEPHEHKH